MGYGKDENKKIHTVFTETKSIQEIGTTHSNIVHRLFLIIIMTVI